MKVTIQPYYKYELVLMYGISRSTFQTWIKPHIEYMEEHLNYRKGQQRLTIPQVKYLFREDVLGHPER